MHNSLLSGKTALITGCGRGIGKAIALTLARAGADIVVNDIDRNTARELAGEITELGRKALVCYGSVGSGAEVEKMFAEIKKEFRRLDILVNNAGIPRDNMIAKMTDSDWDQVMDVNLKGVFYCMRAAAEMMKVPAYGRIVSLTSVAALAGNIGQVNYTAAKAGVIGMTKTLAKELARYQITVNAVAPGFIETSMTAAVPDEVKQTILRAIPLGRAGTPQDIANLVKFLVSDESAYVTGQVISCNGGIYI